MSTWYIIQSEGLHYLARGGTPERPDHVHPIGFEHEREAERACSRLNDVWDA